MNQNTYLNYGVYKDNILFMALGGNFASKAWTESDERFHQIAGTSFQACTGDDGQVYNIGKYNIRRLKSDEEFAKLWKQSHPAFRIFCQVEKLPRTWKKEIEWNTEKNRQKGDSLCAEPEDTTWFFAGKSQKPCVSGRSATRPSARS